MAPEPPRPDTDADTNTFLGIMERSHGPKSDETVEFPDPRTLDIDPGAVDALRALPKGKPGLSATSKSTKDG